MCRGLFLLDMAVIGDVIFTVAEITLAAGTVPELQIRVTDIGTSADGAAMGTERLQIGRAHV